LKQNKYFSTIIFKMCFS